MKKFILILLTSLSFTFTNGQIQGTNDIGVSIGGFTTNDFIDATSNIIASGASGGNTIYTNATGTPSITVYYKRAVKDNWFFYADASFQSISEDVTVEGAKVGDVDNTFITVGFGTEYHYITKDWFQMYSGGSVGYTSQNAKFTGPSDDFKDASDSFFNFQVNALGFRVGRALAATLELGVGYRGIANLGVSYQF